jgi:hypothetical protein
MVGDPDSGMAEIAGVTERIDLCVVAALHPAARMGRPELGRRRRPPSAAVGGRTEGHSPGQTREPGVRGVEGAVARRRAGPAAGPRRAPWGGYAPHAGGAHPRAPHPTTRRTAHLAYSTAHQAQATAGGCVGPRITAQVGKAAPTRADLVELLGSQRPVVGLPRAVIEALVDQVAIPITPVRDAHRRKGHERFTVAASIEEEAAILDLVDASDNRSRLDLRPDDVEGLPADQARAIAAIAAPPCLLQPLQPLPPAGRTDSLKALRAASHRARKRVLVCAPIGKAVDEALHDGAGDEGLTCRQGAAPHRHRTTRAQPAHPDRGRRSRHGRHPRPPQTARRLDRGTRGDRARR